MVDSKASSLIESVDIPRVDSNASGVSHSIANAVTLSLLLPARHWLNLAGLLVVIWFGRAFLHAHDIQAGMVPLLVMTMPPVKVVVPLWSISTQDNSADRYASSLVIASQYGSHWSCSRASESPF